MSVLETVEFHNILFSERISLNHRISNRIVDYVHCYGLPQSLDGWGSPLIFIEVYELRADGKIINLNTSSELGKLRLPIDYDAGNLNILHHRTLVFHGMKLYISDQTTMAGPRRLAIYVASDLGYLVEAIWRNQLFLLIITICAIPLLVFISIALAVNTMKPISELMVTMHKITSEQLDQRVGYANRSDEIGDLARSFDAMLDRLRASFERERRFIADASHELKTPLTVIHGNAQMLRRWAQSDEAVRSESIEIIIRESKALAMLIEEMLLLARIDTGDLVAQDPVDLVELCSELIQSLQRRIGSRPITAKLEARNSPGDLTIIGNAILLRRVFSNLVDNALKFTSDGEIVVILTRLPNEIEILVHDTGIGIAEEDLERIFERLYRSDPSRTRQAEGFGLGLAIAKAFVKFHGGKINARRRSERGSTIGVSLPIEHVPMFPPTS